MVDVNGLRYIGNHGMEIIRDGELIQDPRATPFIPSSRVMSRGSGTNVKEGVR